MMPTVFIFLLMEIVFVMIIIDATFSCAIRGNHPILLVGDRTVLLILGGVCMDDTKESL